MGEIIYFIDGCPGRRRLSSGGQCPVGHSGRIFANNNHDTVTLSLLHRLMHCSVRTDVVVQYIHTYIHTVIIPSIALDCASYHTSTLGESQIRLHSPYRSRENSGRDDIMHYAQNLDIQQRSLYSTEHTLPKTKTTYIHDTS